MSEQAIETYLIRDILVPRYLNARMRINYREVHTRAHICCTLQLGCASACWATQIQELTSCSLVVIKPSRQHAENVPRHPNLSLSQERKTWSKQIPSRHAHLVFAIMPVYDRGHFASCMAYYTPLSSSPVLFCSALVPCCMYDTTLRIKGQA